MKTILLTIFLCILSVQISNSQWVQVPNGMGNITTISLAVSGNNIFAGAGSYQGVYKSTDNGTSWTQTSLNDRTVTSLAANGSNIFAGTYQDGVYLSTDNGTSWTQTSLNNLWVLSLMINGSNILAGTYQYGVYLSTNNGTTWTQTSLSNLSVWDFDVSGNYIFAGTYFNSGLYLSTNNGTNWTQTSLNNISVWELAVSGTNVYASVGIYQGVRKSTDNGTTWNSTPLNNQELYALTASGNNIFAGSQDSGVFISNDNGASWTQRNEGLSDVWINDFCILNNNIFCATHSFSVWRRPLSEVIGIQPVSNEVPGGFSLSQNYPNPFNPNTVISFQLARLRNGQAVNSFATLKVYDLLGREVSVLVNENLKPGTYEIDWNASNYPSGVYYYKLSATGGAGDYAETKKMVLIK